MQAAPIRRCTPRRHCFASVNSTLFHDALFLPLTMSMDERLRRQLLQMRSEEDKVQAQLTRKGEAFDSYPTKLRQLHQRHAARLRRVLERGVWPGAARVGADGAEAAFRLIMHCIEDPALLRMAAPLIEAAAAHGEAAPAQAARLEDRIAALEGRLQRYGTHLDWDAEGLLSPWPGLENPDAVDERRQAAGLPPLLESIESEREHARTCGEHAPTDPEQYHADVEAWARRHGWRS